MRDYIHLYRKVLHMNKDNIILIGMPGAGKSTIGVVLAKVLGYQFIDTDLIIQKEEGKLLWQIIEEKGVEEFINIEDKINSKVNVSKCVIAPGGSAVFGENAMKHFQEIGTVVYLDVDYPILWVTSNAGALSSVMGTPSVIFTMNACHTITNMHM